MSRVPLKKPSNPGNKKGPCAIGGLFHVKHGCAETVALRVDHLHSGSHPLFGGLQNLAPSCEVGFGLKMLMAKQGLSHTSPCF